MTTNRRRATGTAPAREAGARHAVARGLPRQVRIIGGRYRRTPIPVTDAPGLRPTPDRVRETLFNWLAHLVPDLREVQGLDLFAGTGALGFELASRGARRVVLVERNARAAGELRKLQQRLQAQEVELVAGDGLTAALPARSFDLVFLDPPFDAGLMPAALARAAALLAPQGLIYAEASAPLTADEAGGFGLELVRAARAGAVHFHLLRARPS